MCTWTYCLWYLFTASLIPSGGTLINIIMQNKESDRIGKKTNKKKTVSSIPSRRMLISIMQNKVSESMIKNCRIIVIFMNPLFFFHDETYRKMSHKSISVFFKGQGFQHFHYYCSASVCNLTTRMSHRCNSHMIIKTQTVSL